MQRVRDLDAIEVSRHPPLATLGDEQPAFDQGADELFDPEGRAGGAFEDAAQTGRRLRQAEQLGDELGARRLREWAEQQLGLAMREVTGSTLTERPGRRIALRAQRAAEEDR